MTTAETYVTAAYVVFLAVVLVYVVVNSSKVSRLEARVEKLTREDAGR